MDRPASNKPGKAELLLGLFVVWQLSFILLANFWGIVLRGPPEIVYEFSDDRGVEESFAGNAALSRLLAPTSRWEELTGQWQGWSLFAPNIATRATFPLVEIHWDEKMKPVRLRSIFEPDDLFHYSHPPGSSSRLFNYEWRLCIAALAWNELASPEEASIMRRQMELIIRMQWKVIRAYLRWRLHGFQREHPDLPPPQQVVLVVRQYQTPPPGKYPWSWPEPVDLPIARWQPKIHLTSSGLPIEMYDPLRKEFVQLRQKE